jgi:hypothetical protein
MFIVTRVKISQLVNKMCSHCLFPVVDKSGTSCHHLVTTLKPNIIKVKVSLFTIQHLQSNLNEFTGYGIYIYKIMV